MGGNQSRSTRKLTIDNDDPANLITVSGEVADRLKQGVRKPTGPQPSWPATGGGDALGVVPPPYWYEPSLTSIQLRQANAQELKKNDAYWENRIRNLEANHKKMQEIMDLEYKKALQESNVKKEEKAVDVNEFAACCNNRKAVIDCYKKNSREPMKCAKVVQEFTECVDFKRNVLMQNRG